MTGTYTFEGSSNVTTIEQTYHVLSLLSDAFLELSVVEIKPESSYTFSVAQQSMLGADPVYNPRVINYD